jgi:hypothetical protein
MEQSPSRETILFQLVKKFPNFMETEILLHLLQESPIRSKH